MNLGKEVPFFVFPNKAQSVYYLLSLPMENVDTASAPLDADPTGRPPLVIGERDILFSCPNCHGELVVDREGAGLSVACSHCGHALIVPDYQQQTEPSGTVPGVEPPNLPAPAPKRHFDFDGKSREELERRFNELKHQLKENRSQDTEMRGHVNRATMDLHRLQLKLKKLQERHGDIDAEINGLADWLDSDAV